MASAPENIVNEVAEIAPLLHSAGSLSPAVLRAIVRHAEKRDIRFSVETGSGASTLILSHLSANHLVFADDAGSGSISGVRQSELFNQATVTFVEGPSQTTLPRFRFENLFQLALLDGPHAYPFPDLEYFYIYPWLSPGALLILDDIHIRTINNLFAFLRVDEMFDLDEVVGTTAFFTRTRAPVFDPTGDGWVNQRYNKSVLCRHQFRRRLFECLPRKIYGFANSALATLHGERAIEIDFPTRHLQVGDRGLVTGTAETLPGFHLWILVRRTDQAGWWPQGTGPVAVIDGRWECNVNYGQSKDVGFTFEIAVVYVGGSINKFLLSWCKGATGASPPIAFSFRRSAFRYVRRQLTKS